MVGRYELTDGRFAVDGESLPFFLFGVFCVAPVSMNKNISILIFSHRLFVLRRGGETKYRKWEWEPDTRSTSSQSTTIE